VQRYSATSLKNCSACEKAT